MKIGILTLPLNSNYGGVLQAYALQTVLKRMGHDVSEIELKKNLRWQYPPLWKMPLSFGKRFLFKYIVRRKNQKILLERYERKIYPLLVHDILDFISKYINQFKVEKFIDCKGKFDAFVCGSDQIWRYKYYPFLRVILPILILSFLVMIPVRESLMPLRLEQTIGNILRKKLQNVKTGFKSLMQYLLGKRQASSCVLPIMI